ncbi:hypothetical protein KUTeg_003744 [Tegillarca granosa]|uniref:Ribosome biogenesis regulatory protein n=1 Tax=Tegillarca granosa TaxID=220873 RepID=A0ABQ9FN31_TEGGR|nr:hypothetical protein KUTeg_003744 [Tegillarca granosa]
MANLVEEVLKAAVEKDSKYKSIEVHKDIDLDVDEGNLLASDPNPIDTKKLKSNREQFLKKLARDNTQLLLNKIWQLPTEKVDQIVVAKVPKEKAATKWEQYARLKGINKRKKGRMVWDEKNKEYRPRWGYKRANDETQEWVLEVPDTADPMEDQFDKKRKEKKERVAKNELQRLRNIARSIPGVGLTPTDAPTKDYVSKALAVTKRSTASFH